MSIQTTATLSGDVMWYPKAERWRIEIVDSKTLQGVFVKHSTLVEIIDLDSLDPAVVAGLVQIHRDKIEDCIASAEAENWPEKLGLLPHNITPP